MTTTSIFGFTAPSVERKAKMWKVARDFVYENFFPTQSSRGNDFSFSENNPLSNPRIIIYPSLTTSNNEENHHNLLPSGRGLMATKDSVRGYEVRYFNSQFLIRLQRRNRFSLLSEI